MITRLQFDDLRRRLDKTAPTRARAVLQLIDSVDMPETPNHKERRRAKKQQHRHPARSTAGQRRKRWHEPSPQEAEIRELNRLMRKELERAPDEDGEISGPLAVVAQYATPHLLKDFGLDEVHTLPFQHWLMAKFGDVLRNPDPQGYLAWRESCLNMTSEQDETATLI